MINKEKLKQNIKISDVASAEGLELIKQGKNQYTCRCINPHHMDNHPSMFINDEKGVFKCFSCGIYGDIFNLLGYIRPDINGFYNQLKYLDDNYYGKSINIPLSLCGKEKHKNNYQDDKDYIKIMNYIANYWASKLPKEVKDKYILNTDKIAYNGYKGDLNIIQGYGLNQELIKDFKIGFSTYDSKLYKELLTMFDKELIDKTGLFDKRGISLFKGRITIPYFKNGNVVYFSSRQTEFSPVNKYEEAKYKNQKIDNKHYYNEDDFDNECIFITEGCFDCLALKKIGYCSIAIGGINIKNEKRLIKKLEDKLVYIIFDNDLNKAGNKKAIELQNTLKENGINSNIITLPLEKEKTKIDINEYLGKHTKEEFNSLLRF